jgi:DUF1680 family protein
MKNVHPQMNVSRRSFIKNAGLSAGGLVLSPLLVPGQNAAISIGHREGIAEGISDFLKPAASATMRGFIGKKLDLSYENRILAQNVEELVEPFRHRTETRLWQSEFWGKWFTSAVLAYKYRPEPALKKVLQSAIEGLIATQTPDGYIGNYKKENRLEQWDIWGRKYCLLGLLDYYEETKDKTSLNAAIKLTDHLVKEIDEKDGIIVNKGNYRGMAASSVLEPVVKLYKITGDKKYLAFAERIIQQWETPGGPQLISKSSVDVSRRFPRPTSWYSWEQGQKAYEMMSCYEGLLELYRITAKEEYKKAVEQTWTNILENEINIAGSGASVEMWFGGKKWQASPVEHFQETCVTVTWIKLSQQLFRLTGAAKYADAIENSYYNALLAATNTDGSDWAKYTPLNGQRLPGSGQCGMKLNCCVASGPRGLFTLPLATVMEMKDGISINFFIEGSYRLKTPTGQTINIDQHTNYPVSGEMSVELKMRATETMALRIRIPAWSKETVLRVNDEPIAVTAGTFASLTREWSAKDKISLQLDMRGRVERHGIDPAFAAIVRGPVVLALDSAITPGRIGTANKPVQDPKGYIKLSTPGAANNKIWMQYHAPFIPESYTETGATPIDLVLCDYASAGNGTPQSVFQVWMPQLYSPREQ